MCKGGLKELNPHCNRIKISTNLKLNFRRHLFVLVNVDREVELSLSFKENVVIALKVEGNWGGKSTWLTVSSIRTVRLALAVTHHLTPFLLLSN